MNKTYLECSCGSLEHLVRFSYFEDEKDFVYLEIHLAPDRSFFRRLFNAIKYIFGHRSKYGDFDEILLDKNTVLKLKEACEKFLQV